IFAKKMDCILPSVCNKPISEWNNSRHPLLQKSLEKEKRKIVPLTISITEDNRIILISGPNAGGKSVCLKTKGLLQYMIQCGILPPMDEGSEAGIYNGIFIDIGDEQSIENDLSTYSSHLLNMKYFTRHANKGTLLLIDEFGSGTEPLLGGSLAESILEYLNKKECAGIITTHYSNLKHFAASEEGIINGAMLYDNHRMEPLYRLEIGKPGSSYAFEIARKICLDERILETAQNKIGKEHVDFDKNLKDVLRDKRYWENKRKSIRQKEKKLEETLEKYQNKLNESEKDRKKIIQQAKDEAEGLLKASNKAIEKTIRIIKESKANKEKTKEAREELDNIKRKPITNHSEDKEIISKINDIKQQKKRFNLKEKDKEKEEERIKKNIDLTKNDLRVGDKVKLVDQDSLGEIMDINKNSVMVAFGNMFTTVPKDKLTKISNKEFKKQSKSESDGSLATMMYNKKINFNGNIDLRGKKVEEALYELERFIDDAIFVGTSQVRILHGKGFGILRQHIRDYLKSIDAIKKISNEHIERGGDGITLVDFD
ncbi:MAG: endonuclease MutS2, partial [Marinilabiliales bacterium]